MPKTLRLLSRRAALLQIALVGVSASLGVGLVACHKDSAATSQRCAFCGMKIDPTSSWHAKIVIAGASSATEFDTPKCALLWFFDHGKPMNATLRLQEFYSREWRSGADVVFVLGSDVVGPMGNDVVPLDKTHENQFTHDHAGPSPARVRDIVSLTKAELDAL